MPVSDPKRDSRGRRLRQLAAAAAARRREWADSKRALGTAAAVLFWLSAFAYGNWYAYATRGGHLPLAVALSVASLALVVAFPRPRTVLCALMLVYIVYGLLDTYLDGGRYGNYLVAGAAVIFVLLDLSSRIRRNPVP